MWSKNHHGPNAKRSGNVLEPLHSQLSASLRTIHSTLQLCFFKQRMLLPATMPSKQERRAKHLFASIPQAHDGDGHSDPSPWLRWKGTACWSSVPWCLWLSVCISCMYGCGQEQRLGPKAGFPWAKSCSWLCPFLLPSGCRKRSTGKWHRRLTCRKEPLGKAGRSQGPRQARDAVVGNPPGSASLAQCWAETKGTFLAMGLTLQARLGARYRLR